MVFVYLCQKSMLQVVTSVDRALYACISLVNIGNPFHIHGSLCDGQTGRQIPAEYPRIVIVTDFLKGPSVLLISTSWFTQAVSRSLSESPASPDLPRSFGDYNNLSRYCKKVLQGKWSYQSFCSFGEVADRSASTAAPPKVMRLALLVGHMDPAIHNGIRGRQ
jgi:hypothetical protein